MSSGQREDGGILVDVWSTGDTDRIMQGSDSSVLSCRRRTDLNLAENDWCDEVEGRLRVFVEFRLT